MRHALFPSSFPFVRHRLKPASQIPRMRQSARSPQGIGFTDLEVSWIGRTYKSLGMPLGI